MEAKSFGNGAVRASFSVQHRLSRLHALGVGLDFFFYRHDPESDVFLGRAAE